MNVDIIEELARKHGIHIGMRPPMKPIYNDEKSGVFERTEGYTAYGESLIAFARDIAKIANDT